MVHLPPTADMLACKQWADQYFRNIQNWLVDLAILYQPAVVTTGDQNVIMHSFELASTQGYRAWAKRGGRLIFDLPVGVGGPASRSVLQSDTGEQLDTAGRWYIYQSGVIWTAYEEGRTPTNVMLSNPAAGVVRHATVKLDRGAEMELRGVFPPDKHPIIACLSSNDVNVTVTLLTAPIW